MGSTHNIHNHIGIAGAGLLGRLLAWQLLRRGHRVSLFEAGDLDRPRSAAWTAAGMVSPLSEAVVSERPVYDMGLFALSQWPAWIKQLPDTATRETLWQQKGSLVVAHPQDQTELRQFEQELQHVVGNEADYQWLDQRGIQQLEPDLNTAFQQGLVMAQEGHLDNRRLLPTLLGEIRRLGGHCHSHGAVELAPGKITTEEGKETFDWVIDCRGLGAKPGHASLRGVRGEVLHVQTDEVKLSRPVRLMHPRYQLYIVPKPEHHFVIGATQIESEDRSPMSLQSSLELGSALYTLSPAFAEARILEQDVNLRPAFMDNNPHVVQTEGMISANGLFRHGYLLAPAVVEHVLARLEGASEPPFSEFLNRSIPEEETEAVCPQ
ncbi:glycine oxidase ThiO [Marinimicrobium sp. C2-29]|uniref:glycine oxidase ThiO n=1 Tax=Marinimicrobium sp. C2-29 TaxID=3139825 RepID=UPI0031387314